MVYVGSICMLATGQLANVILLPSSTVFVEGDVVMNTYTDAEGKTRTGVRITQSKTASLQQYHALS
jgi:single-stranded DNA-binding protein